MYFIEIPKEINYMMSLFYYVGLWHCGDKATVSETRIKFFFCFYYLLFPISLVAGAIASDNQDEKIFLAEATIASVVLYVKITYVIWKKGRVLDMINHIGVYSMQNYEEFTLVKNKTKRFMKFLTFFFVITSAAGYVALFAPTLGKEKILLFNIGFPLDWKNSETAYWIAITFIFTQINIAYIGILFSILIWYLMINCALRYKLVGRKIVNMGEISEANEITNKRKITDEERNNVFLRDLILAIDFHQQTRE